MSGSIFLESSEISVIEAAGMVQVAIVRTGDLSRATTIEYGTNAGSALSGTDFTELDGFITMAAGQSRVVVNIPIINDSLGESTEGFNFSLVNVSSGSLLFPRTERINILDDETPAQETAIPELVSDYDVEFSTVTDGLGQPIAIEFSPGNSSIAYVASKTGIITAVDITTGQNLGTVLDISTKVNDAADRGLMDIALDPNFPSKPYIYAFYVVDPADAAGHTGSAGLDGDGNRFAYVVRYTANASNGYLSVVPGSEKILVGGGGDSLADISGGGALNFTEPVHSGEQSSAIDPSTGGFKQDYIKVDSLSHAGGSLVFGPDGALYVTTGDGTSFDYADPRTSEVQSIGSLSGKVLRIDPMTGRGFADNPFAEPDLNSNQSKVYQLGLRNPFAAAFDQDGHLILSETGWFSYEEINTGGPGANFGWPYFEGGDNGALARTPIYETSSGASAFYQGVANGSILVTAPVRAFSHANADPGFQIQAIVGANSVYSGDKYPAEFFNSYFFADVVEGEIYAVDINNPQNVKYLATSPTGFAPVHYKMGPDGYLYYADLVTGSIGRLLISSNSTLYQDDAASVQELYGETKRDVFVIDDVSANYLEDATANGLGVVVYSGGKYDILFGFDEIRFKDKTIFVDDIPGASIRGSSGNDSITLSHSARGQPQATNLADIIKARGGNDRVNAGDGNDTISGGSGNDKLRGGDGNDFISGGKGTDFIDGGAGKDTLVCDSGNDDVHGGAGNDIFYVGAGQDRLFGDDGADQFLFSSAASGIARIADFEAGKDLIVLDSARFTEFTGHQGTLDDAAFVQGPFADAAERRIAYDPGSGKLIYDSNGDASGGAVQIATLGQHLDLTHSDFLII
jgi:glucose/arabinose dehydrogenase